MRSRTVFATRTWDATATIVTAVLGELRPAADVEFERRRTA